MTDEPVDLNKLWQFLDGLGAYAQPEVRDEMAKQIAASAAVPTAPSPVALRLPPATRAFFQFALVRAFLLAPQVTHAAKAGCHVEAVTLAHGAAQLAARALYVAWLQGTRSDPLGEEEVRPFYEPESASGTLNFLTPRLRDSGLLSEAEAEGLTWLNKNRNKVVHGVIFGELELPQLLPTTVQAARASLNTLLAALRWLRGSASSDVT